MTPTPRPSTAAPILAALAIVLLPLGAYVAGYFWLGEVQHSGGSFSSKQVDVTTHRIYPHPWQSRIFAPAAWLETKWIGRDVQVWDRESIDQSIRELVESLSNRDN